MKKQWPKIIKVEKNGKSMLMVDARKGGQGERRFFDTKAEADGFAHAQRIRRHNEGGNGFDDTRLTKYGWTVAKAIDFALAHLDRQSASTPLSDAVRALCAAKDSEVGAPRLADIKNRLARFSAHFPRRTIATITEAEIADFLSTIPHPVTRNDYRKEIVMLWQYATGKSRGWATPLDTRNELKRAAEPEKARIILTVEQAGRLMEASLDPEVLALNALVLFGGCRREEVEKMDWQHVDFESGHINITAAISKVSAERFAPICDNLRGWLATVAKKSGPIVSRTITKPLRDTWKRAGVYPWPQDAHRHSFISYRRQIVGDSQTALEGGTSETIIKRHYKRPVTRAQADSFFSIRPLADSKVVQMAA